MFFLIIQLILVGLIISICYFIFVFVFSLDLPILPDLLDGLIKLLLSIYLSYFVIVFIFALINKICRMLLKTNEGEVTGINVGLWAIKETSWDIVQTVSHKIFFHSPLPDFLLRLFGFKKNKNTTILGDIMDPEMISIGSGTVIGTRAIISGHHIRRGKLYRKRVTIGENCTIGGHTIVLPGVEIEDNVLVSAVSLIPSNWKLESNSIYSGTPVKKVKEIDPENIN